MTNDENIDMTRQEAQAIGIMEDPRAASQAQIEAMQQDDSLADDCRMLDDMATVLRQIGNIPEIDVDKEFREFQTKHRAAAIQESDQQSASSPESHRPRRKLRVAYLSVAIAVAAGLAALFVLWPMANSKIKNQNSRLVSQTSSSTSTSLGEGLGEASNVVYEASAATQQVTIKAGDKNMTVKGNSISYEHAANNSSATTEAQVISIPGGRTFTIRLSDGSEVYLNANSSLQYPVRFLYKKREVTLLKGEAYFKVAHDTSRPFVVKCGGASTTVLGTEFNVRHREGEAVSITLVEGKVRVSAAAKGTSSVSLSSGQQATVGEAGQPIDVREVDTDQYTYWMDGYFYFDGAPLTDIMREIGNWYNVSVVFNNVAAMNTEIHFVGDRNAPLDKTISLLNDLDKAKIAIEQGRIVVR